MKTARRLIVFAATATLSMIALATHAADSTERTSMPEVCSERNVNCVIPDGPPRRIAHPAGANSPIATPAGAAQGGSSSTSGASAGVGGFSNGGGGMAAAGRAGGAGAGGFGGRGR